MHLFPDVIPFLRHIVGLGHIRMESGIVKGIVDWVELKNFIDMIFFFGETDYRRKFVEGYSKITAPLTNLLKKGK